MSKTLFNQNTFNDKNVKNSNNVDDIKIDILKATTATITNATITDLSNAELQAATTGVAQNASDITDLENNKQDILRASNRLNPNYIDAVDDGDSAIITNTEFGSLTGFNNDDGTIQNQIDSKAKLYDVEAPLVKTTREVIVLPQNPILLSVNHTDTITDGSTDLIESGAVHDGLALKEDAFNVSASGTLIKDTGSTPHLLSINVASDAGVALGNNQLIYGGGIYQYLLDNYNKKLTNGSTLQLSIDDTGSGININDEISVVLATGASQTDFGLVNGKLLDDELATKQDTLTDAANGGTGISIDGAGVISADTYGVLSNGGLGISVGKEFSLDLTNTNADIEIPQQVIIRNNDEPQLLVSSTTLHSNDVAVTIRGSKSGSTSARQAQLRFENYDANLSDENLLGEIGGFVLDDGTNVGGLIFGNYADGNTGKSALSMNQNGKFNFTGSVPRNSSAFQDEVKINVDGDVFVRQGLVLEPFDMGVTTFSNGRDDSASSSASREKIYIKFLPFGDTDGSDWFYLREISTGTNAGHLALDFHDDSNDVRFSIRNVHSSGQDPDVITEVFDVKSAGVTAHTAVYRIPQMIFYNFDPAQLGNNESGNAKWGEGGIQDVLIATPRITGTQLASHSNGTITISSDGYYRIKVSSNVQQQSYGDRLAFAVYLQIGGTSYFKNAAYNFFGWNYTRNNGDGAHGSITFEDYIYIAASTTVEVRNKLDVNNLTFDDDLNESQLENYLSVQIERIAETDIS